MQDVVNERRTTYGLRVKKTGEMLRVEHASELTGHDENPSSEISYTFTLDESYPVFDAGSAEHLALVFAYPNRGHSETPHSGGFKPEELEPVEIEETVTRTVKPTGMAFEVPVRLRNIYTLDLNKNLARGVEGLREILDEVDAHKDELASQRQPGSTYEWGKHRLVGMIVPGEPDTLPEGFEGSIILDQHGNGPRRALVAIPLPEKMIDHLKHVRDGGTTGSLVVCLSDTRPAPEALLDALGEMSATSVPGPR